MELAVTQVNKPALFCEGEENRLGNERSDCSGLPLALFTAGHTHNLHIGLTLTWPPLPSVTDTHTHTHSLVPGPCVCTHYMSLWGDREIHDP